MAGYSGTPLVKKLGLKAGYRAFVHAAPSGYFDWLSPLDPQIEFAKSIRKPMDFIHVFAKDQKTFENWFVKGRDGLSPKGMLWISWPKKSSKVPTDLDENIIREFGLSHGMVDVKVCAVDEVWSGLKFMFRIADRS
jgi:hypothetical protein